MGQPCAGRRFDGGRGSSEAEEKDVQVDVPIDHANRCTSDQPDRGNTGAVGVAYGKCQDCKRRLVKISTHRRLQSIHEGFGNFIWNVPVPRSETAHCKWTEEGTGKHTLR